MYEAWSTTISLPGNDAVRAAVATDDAAAVFAAGAADDPGVAASLAMTRDRKLYTHPARRETRQAVALVPELPKPLRWHVQARDRTTDTVAVHAPGGPMHGFTGSHFQAMRQLAVQVCGLGG